MNGRISDTISEENVSLERSRHKDTNNKVAFKSSHPISLELDPNFNDRYTPNTLLDDYNPDFFDETTLTPDVSVLCRLCRLHIYLDDLSDHTQYHAALSVLGLNALPDTEKQLMEIRKALINAAYAKHFRKPSKDLKTQRAVTWNCRIVHINEAYELIKSYINNSFEMNRQLKNNMLKMDIHGEGRLSTNLAIVAIGSCSNQNKSHRLAMEDTSIVLENFGENKDITYIGIFDGYDGTIASKRCIEQLHLAMLPYLSQQDELCVTFDKDKYVDDEINHLAKYDKSLGVVDNEKIPRHVSEKSFNEMSRQSSVRTVDEDEAALRMNEQEAEHARAYKHAFLNAYRKMDTLLARGRGERSKVRWSGATGFTCVIEHMRGRDGELSSLIHVANCGDVEAIVVLDNTANKSRIKRNYRILSRLHTIDSCVKDRDRVEKSGAHIIETSQGQRKIEGIYSNTRGVGFFGDRLVKPFISATPSVKSFRIESNQQCIIIATKGLWNALSYDKVADIVLQTLPLTVSQHVYSYERVTSPSVKTLLHQYYHSRAKDKIKDKSHSLQILNENETMNEEQDEEYDEESNGDERDTSTHSSRDTRHTFSNHSTSVSSSRSEGVEVTESKQHGDSPDINIASLPFYIQNRPRSVPHHIFRTKGVYGRNDDTEEHFVDDKANSDIFPVAHKHALVNEYRDLALDMYDLDTIDKEHFESARRRGSADNKKRDVREEYKAKMIFTHVKATNVREYELDKAARSRMDAKLAKRLDLVESICERLVTSALLAGSLDNITVNCVLLPGSSF